MKKKLILALSTLFFVCFACVGFVNATVTARVPSAIPDEDDVLYAILDDEFDFSKISFTTEDGTSIAGHSVMKKIILTVNPNTTGTGDVMGDSWFTVYCLDGNLKFPQYSVYNIGDYDGLTDERKMDTLLMAALFNNLDYYELFKKAEGYIFEPEILYTLPDGSDLSTVLSSIDDGNEITVNVESITYSNLEGTQSVVISAGDLAGDATITSFPVSLKKSQLLFDKYTSTVMSGDDYSHALWILEHSYPTLSLKESLEVAGADFYETVGDIAVLTGKVTEDERTSYINDYKTIEACTAKSEIASKYSVSEDAVTVDFCANAIQTINEQIMIEDYVYSTVQYAIWNANNGIDVNGNKLGDTLIGSDELNKLYQYLIKDRSIYKGYLNYQFNNTLTLNNPTSGKEIYKETDDYYVYGPYSVDYDLISIDDVMVSLTKAVDGASIVDEAGNAISSIEPSEKFYIKALKSKKIANLGVTISTQKAKAFQPTSNRGRIYYAYYPKTQNVVSGGKIVETDIEKNFELVFNPKTGVENVAVLFVITLIAFSLAYVVLIYKNKPVELN